MQRSLFYTLTIDTTSSIGYKNTHFLECCKVNKGFTANVKMKEGNKFAGLGNTTNIFIRLEQQ